MPRQTVFKNIQKLHPQYIPEKLPYREKQLKKIEKIYTPTIQKQDQKTIKWSRLLGPVGSGKTTTITKYIQTLEKTIKQENIPLKILNINCKIGYKNRRSLYKKILEKITQQPQPSLTHWEYLDRIIETLAEQKKYLFLVLDDVDYLIRREKQESPNGGLVYDLTRLGEYYPTEKLNILGIVFIAQKNGFSDVLDMSERSSLGLLVIRLNGYSQTELRDILRARTMEAFKNDAVSPEILDYVSSLTSWRTYYGDCRYALGLLYSSGVKADEAQSERVQVCHIRKAASENCWGPSLDELSRLGFHKLYTCLGVVQALRCIGRPYVSKKAVHEFYEMVCDAYSVKPRSYSRVKQIIDDLYGVGVDYFREKGVSLFDVPLDDFERAVKKALERKNAE